MAVENLEKLWLIGHMINLYRIENRKLYNDEYSIERFCEGICTRNTLKRIENGERCRESTYMNILSKFDLLFGDFPKIDEALLLMLDQLYNAIEFYDIPSVKEYCQKALTLLERVRNYVVYSELYMLFKDVYDHFQYDIIISRDSMHHYLKLIEIMPDAYDDLIRLLILNRLPLDAIENGKEYNNHIKNCKNKHFSLIISSFFIAVLYMLGSSRASIDFLVMIKNFSIIEYIGGIIPNRLSYLKAIPVDIVKSSI